MYSRKLTGNEGRERGRMICKKLVVTIKDLTAGLQQELRAQHQCHQQQQSMFFAGRAPNTIILCVCVTYSKENISVHDEHV